MQKILVINSSVRQENSNSRQLVAKIIHRLQNSSETACVTHRDLAQDPLPHFDAASLAGFSDPSTEQEHAAAELSDTLIAELKGSDTVVIGLPVYNFSIPSTLKAWIDNVARAGVTFSYSEKGPEGFITGKKVYIVTARGGGRVDHIEMQLKETLAMMGMTDVTFVHAASLDTPQREQALAEVHAQIDELFSQAEAA